ncbi:TIGR02594 family protein [Aureimonas sp. AU22]|uniref:NlpC/P60 family protein n=1 Tax=Aureimonas sp. AU22 TaxID=1638162 RepID=UPI000783750B|nr:TIGR02594 family protein [Aureimonas sp. AU22]
MSDRTLRIQTRLRALGYDPGPSDGIHGRRTIAAVRAFQSDQKLVVDGIVGPLTLARLFAGEAHGAESPDHPWYQEARRLVGTREVPGQGSNPVIEDWAEGLGIPYRGDDIPWCGLFVAHCIGATLPQEPLPAHPLGARNWARFGTPCDPGLGCVLVFWRESRASGKGHVGFYAGEDETGFYVLGGNQSDAVNVKRLPRSQFLGARWPATAPSAARQVVRMGLTSGVFETSLS